MSWRLHLDHLIIWTTSTVLSATLCLDYVLPAFFPFFFGHHLPVVNRLFNFLLLWLFFSLPSVIAYPSPTLVNFILFSFRFLSAHLSFAPSGFHVDFPPTLDYAFSSWVSSSVFLVIFLPSVLQDILSTILLT